MPPAPRPIDYEVDAATGCWNCTSHSCSTRGGPQLVRRVAGKQVHASIPRIVYLRVHGEIAEDQVIRQRCGNPRCINPAHLAAVNAGEAVSTGPRQQERKRRTAARRQQEQAQQEHERVHGRFPEWVPAARALRDNGASYRQIGRELGISPESARQWLKLGESQ